jgi:hypothetical protein
MTVVVVVTVGAHRLCTSVVPTPADSGCRLYGTISATAIEVPTHCAKRVIAPTADDGSHWLCGSYCGDALVSARRLCGPYCHCHYYEGECPLARRLLQ